MVTNDLIITIFKLHFTCQTPTYDCMTFTKYPLVHDIGVMANLKVQVELEL